MNWLKMRERIRAIIEHRQCHGTFRHEWKNVNGPQCQPNWRRCLRCKRFEPK